MKYYEGKEVYDMTVAKMKKLSNKDKAEVISIMIKPLLIYIDKQKGNYKRVGDAVLKLIIDSNSFVLDSNLLALAYHFMNDCQNPNEDHSEFKKTKQRVIIKLSNLLDEHLDKEVNN